MLSRKDMSRITKVGIPYFPRQSFVCDRHFVFPRVYMFPSCPQFLLSCSSA